MYLSSGIQVIIEIISIIKKSRRNLNLEVDILLLCVQMGDQHHQFPLVGENQAVGSLKLLPRPGEEKVAQRGNVEEKEPTAWGPGKGQAKAGAQRSREGEGDGPVLVGDRGTMGPLVIVQDPSPQPQASQRVPLWAGSGWL